MGRWIEAKVRTIQDRVVTLALAADIGGTKIAVGLVSANGAVPAAARVPTPAQEGSTAVLAAAEAAVADVLDNATPLGSAALWVHRIGLNEQEG